MGLIEQYRTTQLKELGELALRRSEAAIEYGSATLDTVAQTVPLNCDAATLQSVRLHVYQRGGVKDIRIVEQDGSVICSAYSETLEFDKVWAKRSEMSPSANGVLRLFRVEQFFGIALGVLKDMGRDKSLVAVLNIDESLFDIMPSDLAKDSTVELQLVNGQQVAHYGSATKVSLL